MNSLRPPNPVLAVLGRLLQSVLNRAVALDAETRSELRRLDGRAVSVDFSGTPFKLRLAVAGDRLEVGPADSGDSQLRVAASPGSLLGLALRRGDNAMAPGKVDIAGDAELAQRLEKLARGFRPDLEEAFARVFGDVLGVKIAQMFTGAFETARSRGKALLQDGADYLREDGGSLVAPGEMEQFLDEVDVLRERSERLEARLARLAAAAEKRA